MIGKAEQPVRNGQDDKADLFAGVFEARGRG